MGQVGASQVGHFEVDVAQIQTRQIRPRKIQALSDNKQNIGSINRTYETSRFLYVEARLSHPGGRDVCAEDIPPFNQKASSVLATTWQTRPSPGNTTHNLIPQRAEVSQRWACLQGGNKAAFYFPTQIPTRM